MTDTSTAAICTWPSCKHTAKGQCRPQVDVPALSAERDRLAAQIVQLQRELDAAKVRAERAEAALAAGPNVKPLEWHENPDVGEGGFIARGLFGVAYHAMADGWKYYRRGLWADAKSLSDAKAAAQADYEARILSALEKPHD